MLLLHSCDFKTADDYYNLAKALEDENKFEEAIEMHDLALKKNPKMRPSLINRGADKSALGDYKGAIKDYNAILKFDSDNLLAMMNIGNNYENLNEFDKAIQYYTDVLESDQLISSGPFKLTFNTDLFPDEGYRIEEYEALFERGTAYLIYNDFENAIIDLDKLVRTGYMVKDANYYLGEAYLGINDTIKACEYFKLSYKNGAFEAKDQIKIHCR